MIFPLRFRPAESYHEPPRSFGAGRGHAPQTVDAAASLRHRLHAGCDLYGKAGDEVLAMADGEVIRGPYLFYEGVFALEIRHDFGIVRYGEMSGALLLHPGEVVKEGRVIGAMGRMDHVPQAMLHLELYAGAGAGPLTDRARPPYMRRGDLQDPTSLLDAAELLRNPWRQSHESSVLRFRPADGHHGPGQGDPGCPFS